MCFCDGYSYLVTNKSNGEKHLIKGDDRLYAFFKGRYCIVFLLHRLMKKEYVQLDGVLYSISGNTHPECERIKMELIKLHGTDPFELLGKCPEKYRCLLPEERQ